MSDTTRIGDYNQISGGCRFWPLDQRPEEVFIEHIAHSFSNLCRFTGHCSTFYSVASHSILVSKMVPPRLAAHALLHDAAEAYIGDISNPLKKFLWVDDCIMSSIHTINSLVSVENKILSAIYKRFDLLPLSPSDAKAIKHADMCALATEARDLMQPVDPEWQRELDRYEPWLVPVELHSPEHGKQAFMFRWEHALAAYRSYEKTTENRRFYDTSGGDDCCDLR